MTDNQTDQSGLVKGAIAMYDLIDEKKQPTGEQIEVTIKDVRYNGAVPQSYRVYCKTERDTDKYIWVKAEFVHETVVEVVPEPEASDKE